METLVAVKQCLDYNKDNVYSAARDAVGLLGGLGRIAGPGKKVLIKPNMLSAHSPEEGVTTHPEVARAMIRLVKEAGAIPVVADSPAGTVKVMEVYEKCGLAQVCREEKTELAVFDKFRMIDNFPIAEKYFQADAVISLPKFKTHNLTVLTGAVKNMFGLIPGQYKAHCHKHSPNFRQFARVLARFYGLCRPHLAMVDAVVAMGGQGPVHGELVNVNKIIAGWDAASVDAVLALIMGINPGRILHLNHIQEKNLGQIDLKYIKIIGDNIDSLAVPGFQPGRVSWLFHLPNWLLKTLARFVCIGPKVDLKECRVCGICLESCPMGAMEMDKGKVRINRLKCVFCLCCNEFCPHGAIKVKKIG